jgi:GNAT superfamily N-acetyltransferase
MLRAATIDDLPALVELGAVMHAESPRYARLRFDAGRLAQTLTGLLSTPDGFLWVAEREGEIVGGLAAVVVQHWCSADRVAADLALFMTPDARGTLAPARLVNRYVAWARERGAVHVQFGVSTGVHPEQTAQLLERLGFARCGILLET